MYRSLLAPSIFSEASGQYRSFAGDVRSWTPGQPPGSRYRTDMSLWDIHRSQSAWLTLAAPSAARDVTNSLTRMEADGGRLPRWPLANVYTGCMVGSHAVAVMADATLRGTGGVNATAAFAAALRAVEQQANSSKYGSLGYVPSEESARGASETMAFAFDDGVVSNWAAAAAVPGGAPGPEGRAGNWKNALTAPADSLGPFPCPRSSAGAFSCPDDLALPYPFETSYVEADAWQNRWFVPAQAEELVAAFADNATFASQLELLMNQSLSWPLGGEKSWLPNAWYWAGNEPGLFAPWQFVFAGNAYAPKTQFWVRLMTQLAYGPDFDGLPGNDDFGTMSAWQVLSLLGMYPIPGSNQLVLGSPGFQNATLALPPAEAATALGFVDLAAACAADVRLCSRFGETDLVPLLTVSWDADVVTGPGLGVYATGATLNGQQLSRPVVSQQLLMRGAGAVGLSEMLDAGASTLVFHSSATPQPWGV